MDTTVVISLIDPSVDEAPIGGVTPSAVIGAIIRVVGGYAAGHPAMGAADAWGTGLNHVVLTTPAGRGTQTSTFAAPDLTALLGPLVRDLALGAVSGTGLRIEKAAALSDLSDEIGERLLRRLGESGSASLLVVLATAIRDAQTGSPVLRFDLAQRTFETPAPAAGSGAAPRLTLAAADARYAFGFGGLADPGTLQTWKGFVASTAGGLATPAPEDFSSALLRPGATQADR